MAPPPAATAAATAPARCRCAAGPARRAGRGAEAPATRRAPLRVVPTRAGAAFEGAAPLPVGAGCSPSCPSPWWWPRCWPSSWAQALLANGQVRLSALQHELTLEQSAHRQAELAVAAARDAVADRRRPPRASSTWCGRPASSSCPTSRCPCPSPRPKVTPAPAPPPPTTSVGGQRGDDRASTARASRQLRQRASARRDDDADRRRRERHDPTRASTARAPVQAGGADRSPGRRPDRALRRGRRIRTAVRPAPARPSDGRRRPAPPGRRSSTAPAAAAPSAPPAGEGRPAPALAPAARLGERHLPRAGCGSSASSSSWPCCSWWRGWSTSRCCTPAPTQAAARGESSITVSLPSLRGGIYDRDGSPLALSVPTDDVVADDFQVAHPVQTAAGALAHPPRPGRRRWPPSCTGSRATSSWPASCPSPPARRSPTDAFPGITLIDDSKREVPNGNLAAPVVGFTNAAGQGAGGLEYGDNHLLAGTDGKETIMESPGRRGAAPVPGDEPGGHDARAPDSSSRSTPSSSTSRSRRWPRRSSPRTP